MRDLDILDAEGESVGVAQGQQRFVAAIDSIEEAEASASARLAPVTLNHLDRRTPFHWRATMVELGAITVTAQEYGGAFSGNSPEGSPDRLALSLPLTSVGGESTIAGRTHAVARGRSTYFYSPPGGARFRFDSHYRGLQMMIGMAAVSATLSALMGAPLRAPLRFESRLSLEAGLGPALERVASFVIDESAREDGFLSDPAVAHKFGESVLVKLLHGQNHNYTDRLNAMDRAADPQSVRLATEYLEANLARPVRITELAAIAGVSARALQIGFQKHRGSTPVEFLREQRLVLARRLLETSPTTPIADVAKRCGFTHLGRFSARYRTRFGELPIDTRRRLG